MTARRTDTRTLLARFVGLMLLWLLPVWALSAQDFGPTIRALRFNSEFRVRAQAAMTLGRTGEARFATDLERALGDVHPAVRLAVAVALGRVATATSLPALRRAAQDPVAEVRRQAAASLNDIEARAAALLVSPRQAPQLAPATGLTGLAQALPTAPPSLRGARWVVSLGAMRDRSRGQQRLLENVLRLEVARRLGAVARVAVVVDPTKLDRASAEQIRRDHLPYLRIDGTIHEMTRKSGANQVATHASISLLLSEQGKGALRAVMNGSATGIAQSAGASEPVYQRLASQAVRGAVESALKNVATVLVGTVRS